MHASRGKVKSADRSQNLSTVPLASRPYMPGYGLPAADKGEGLLPWEWAVERLTESHNYWVATTRPEGRPHVMPVWGIWVESVFYFSTLLQHGARIQEIQESGGESALRDLYRKSRRGGGAGGG